MVNKLIIDGVNTELSEKSQMPYTYTFSQAKVHSVRIALDNTNEICAEAFKDCPRLTSISFPEQITMIKRRAFENCTGLKSITIPPTIEYIGANVFNGCTNLTEVDFEATTPPDVYCEFPDNCRCFVPDGSKYGVVDTSSIDLTGNTQYYTKTFYGSYVEVDDPATMTNSGTYYFDKWVDVAANDITVEYKDRTPIDEIVFENSTIQIQANQLQTLSYSFLPENETNHRITWVSGNENLVHVVDTSHEGLTYVQVANVSTLGGTVKMYAYAESGVFAHLTLRIVGGTLSDTGNAGDNTGDTGNTGETGGDISYIDPNATLITDIMVNNKSVKVGSPINIDYTIIPTDATNTAVKFEYNGDKTGVDLSDASVGVITEPGNYEIKIKALDGSNVSKTFTISVTE